MKKIEIATLKTVKGGCGKKGCGHGHDHGHGHGSKKSGKC